MQKSQPQLADIQQLIEEIVLPFYRVERHTPLRFAPGRYENDAEHSWSVALVAAALAPHIDKQLDVGKICQFAVVHDLVEVYAGDTSNFAAEAEKATKEAREKAAQIALQKNLAALPWIAATIAEYEEQTSAEAKFVKSIDKLLPLLFDYIEKGLFYQENHERRMATATAETSRESDGARGRLCILRRDMESAASKSSFFSPAPNDSRLSCFLLANGRDLFGHCT